ncbi:tRNA pseudouridine(55) synthase TruB [Leptospira interrogans]|uniref:tRNA pseudouridine synthase B n=4 Tax=Leptospira interrogans TaxID=173 RepID=TRUB_LEPIC|nr:tRNA pseudouridine(55) synthase TruB [Leptospira interrogans]Q72NX5.2 RecName: Full=tRNA pseudouridine synthase B; AltName: Full=tRNA pseudouridine(55) synthase; Short=Psi55 synthase; AltName: Full=tRNA pseudouridylate synthase; AltName: Full=tRNA-uridine isomerase [Leptospira interrogans serovar Copenhageni str. Fiocruz L1-130]APH42494.1 tRNA pseudouridine synthase B [Leptospira interrogans serovar Copenhageni/Icterohaemorrhagiae]EMG23029.1 tRNA pseudouridine(55) synthase [Leptospira interro
MNRSDLLENPRTQTESGFLLIHKPVGMTSSDLVVTVRKKLGFKKVGHTGTLDRAASGLMILPIGSCTSFSSVFLEKEKSYEAWVRPGESTDSGDKEGEILESLSKEQTETWFQEHQEKLRDLFEQVPTWETQEAPEVSALKVNGRRRSDLFREGVALVPAVRKIKIYRYELGEFSPESISFQIRVSAGTYIRKIVMDISDRIGFPLRLEKLVRTSIGKLNLNQADSYESLLDGKIKIHPPETILDFPTVEVPDTEVRNVLNGRKIKLEWIPVNEFLLVSPEEEILAWCKKEEHGIHELDYKYLRVFPKN